MHKNLLKRGMGIFVLFLLITTTPGLAQNVVTGKITEYDGDSPLIGVNVLLKGKNTGTISDVNGEYRLEAESNDVLIFSFIGYISEEVPVNNRSVVDVTLVQDIQSLSELVVMGYSQKTKNEITASVTQLSDKEIEGVTSSNVESMLQGKVAGLTVTTPSGAPGSTPEIRIRGISSLNADRPPLVVVDGIIGGTYQPNDVESITILKDAGATALYGSRAAAGVMVVTTKRGTSAEPVIQFKSTVGIKEVSTGNFDLMNSEEIYQYHEQIRGASLQALLIPDSIRSNSFDWFDETYAPAVIQNYYLSASANTEKINYFISGDYFHEEGNVFDTDFERFSLRSNVDFDLNERLTLRTNISLNKESGNQADYRWTENPYRYLPYDNPFIGTSEKPRFIDGSPGDNWFSRDQINIFHSQQYSTVKSKGLALSGNAILTYAVNDWLTLESRNRATIGNSSYEVFYDPRTTEGATLGGSISVDRSFYQDYISTNLFRIDKAFDKHQFVFFAGFEGSTYFNETFGGAGGGLPGGVNVPSAASAGEDIFGTNVSVNSMSALSELSYNFDERYFVSLAFRMDGSSKFGPERRWGYFPAASASWIISNEEFMAAANKFIPYLKLRGSYGSLGNDNIGNLEYLSPYIVNSQYNSNSAARVVTLPNPSLGWETNTSANVGLDFSLLGKVDFTIDYYNNVSNDMLLLVPLPISQGFKEIRQNTGSIRNTGLEISLGGDIVEAGDFRWNTNFNISHNTNEVLSLGGTDTLIFSFETINQLLVVGEPLYQWYLPKWIGVNPENGDPIYEELVYGADGQIVERRETDRNPGANSTDQFQTAGSALPKFYGGFSNSFSFKGFDLRLLMSYQYGNHIYHRTRMSFDNDGQDLIVNSMKLMDDWSRWENPGDQATHPLPKVGGNKGSAQASSRYVEDGSFVRLRNISLSYNFPEKLVSRIGLGSLRMYASADNLYTWTKFSGMDPEVALDRNNTTMPGISSYKYPVNKQYLLGLEFSF